MNKRLLRACHALILVGGLSTVVTAAKPVTYVSVPLVMSLRDTAATDGVLSDGGGVYTDEQQNVRAVLVATVNANFVFDTNDQTRMDGGRRLVLDFHGQPTVPFASPVAFPVDVFIGTITVSGDNPADNLKFMHAGQSLQRRARFAWVDGSLQYSLRWDGPENGHTFLNFQCDVDNGAASPQCTQWTVTPQGLAGLYSTPAKNQNGDTYYGSYSMPFAMTLFKK